MFLVIESTSAADAQAGISRRRPGRRPCSRGQGVGRRDHHARSAARRAVGRIEVRPAADIGQSRVVQMTLTAAEPAQRRRSEVATEPPTAIVCTFWNVAATTATPENGVVSPGVASVLPVRTGIVPVVPLAVI